MRQIVQTEGRSLAVGKLGKGCRRCIFGRKAVLFVSGICDQDCWYCTISHGRWQKDNMFINEKPIKSDQDVIDEIKACGATGVGITGGDPSLFIDRVSHYIKLLKKEFGRDFNIHMYTHGLNMTPEKLKVLNEAGLDEIRFHLNREAVKDALQFKGWRVGMEVPCIPTQLKHLCNLIDYLEAAGAHYVNLNELEFSERNNGRMKAVGMNQNEDSLTAVEGSFETGRRVLEYARKNAKNLVVHFCTASLMMNFQLKNRLRNRAENIKQPFETVTEDSFLLKGAAEGKDLNKVVEELEKLGIKHLRVREDRNRVEFSEADAEKVAKKTKLKISIVEEYPSAEPWDFESTPLN